MNTLRERLVAYAGKVAASVDVEDDLQLRDAFGAFLLSVSSKRRAEVENELVAIANEGEISNLDRDRLAFEGFRTLISRAATRIAAHYAQDEFGA